MENKIEAMKKEAEAAMETVVKLGALLPFTMEHIEKTSFEERKNDGLGIAIAHYTKWSGVDIMEIFYSALEDANFHKEAAQVAKMLKKYDIKEEVRS